MARTSMLGTASRFPRVRAMASRYFIPSTTNFTSPHEMVISFLRATSAPTQKPNCGDLFYTYQILLDLKVEEGLAIRIEPHPRFYTDPTETVPIAVPALLRNWWPMMNFALFKS